MPGRPRRSCESCGAQKLRYCGQKPTCQRCRRLGRLCVYRPLNNPSSRRSGVSRFRLADAPAESLLSRFSVTEKQYFGIPSSLIPTLIDLYFTHIYNAHLLVHRPTLDSALESETVRVDVLLSICALASKFHTDSEGHAILAENKFGHEWAEAAGRMAFREVESPCDDNVVVFVNLALFWYSVGQFRRASMHSACASNTVWILGIPPNEQEKEAPLKSEMRRRKFWACYLVCMFQPDSLYPRVSTEAILDVKLPCSESEFGHDSPQAGASLKSSESTQSIYAELVRAMALWSSVVALIKKPEPTPASHLAAIQTLDGRIHESWSRLDKSLHLDYANMASIPLDELPRLVLLHVIYHQCLCSLHSSIVPLFSWSSCNGHFSYAQQLSAQTAFEHADSISTLLRAVLDLDWDSRRMPSFVGYAAYCTCAIQIPFLWCSRPAVKQRAVRNILANLKTLQVLGNHWTFLDILGKFACSLYKIHASEPFPLTDEPKNMTPEALEGFKQANPRTRLSILAHNSILISAQGSTAQGADDIADLGLDDAQYRDPVSGKENITGFISQLSHELRAINSQLPITTEPFVPSGSLGFYNLDEVVDWSTRGPDMVEFGQLDDWILELLQQSV